MDSVTILTAMLMGMSLGGALLAVSLNNILHAIFGLALALFGIAGLFFVLGSPFVGIMEVLIYVGGISVAMIFAVMLSSVMSNKRQATGGRKVWSMLVAGLVFAGIGSVLSHTEFGPRPELGPEPWDVARLGEALLDRYNVVFELLSIILLLAIIGAIVISKKDQDQGQGADA